MNTTVTVCLLITILLVGCSESSSTLGSADPIAQNSESEKIDTDGDGVVDVDDEFPSDFVKSAGLMSRSMLALPMTAPPTITAPTCKEPLKSLGILSRTRLGYDSAVFNQEEVDFSVDDRLTRSNNGEFFCKLSLTAGCIAVYSNHWDIWEVSA